jgi:hypothetical protein
MMGNPRRRYTTAVQGLEDAVRASRIPDKDLAEYIKWTIDGMFISEEQKTNLRNTAERIENLLAAMDTLDACILEDLEKLSIEEVE